MCLNLCLNMDRWQQPTFRQFGFQWRKYFQRQNLDRLYRLIYSQQSGPSVRQHGIPLHIREYHRKWTRKKLDSDPILCRRDSIFSAKYLFLCPIHSNGRCVSSHFHFDRNRYAPKTPKVFLHFPDALGIGCHNLFCIQFAIGLHGITRKCSIHRSHNRIFGWCTFWDSQQWKLAQKLTNNSRPLRHLFDIYIFYTSNRCQSILMIDLGIKNKPHNQISLFTIYISVTESMLSLNFRSFLPQFFDPTYQAL